MRRAFENPAISIFMFPDIDIVRTTANTNISAINTMDDGRAMLTKLEARVNSQKAQQVAEIMQIVK